jgi:uncharacterized protein (TIGR02145 family)
MSKKFYLAVFVMVVVGLVLGCGVPKPYHYLDESAISDGGEPNNCGKDGTASSCKTVVIGSNIWMAENLNREMGKSWCYDNKDALCDKFGRLYDLETAMKACPDGYHLPSATEWDTLVARTGGGDMAGKNLKSAQNWYGNGSGTDEFGFSALPGGNHLSGGDGNIFSYAGGRGYWWMGRKGRDGKVGKNPCLVMEYNWNFVYDLYGNKSDGFSVRCVQNTIRGGGNNTEDGEDNDYENNDAVGSSTMVVNGDQGSSGNPYESVVIGGTRWMKTNLNIATDGSWCYDDKPANCKKYGRLYTWNEAKNVCPSGWRLPDTADWRRLVVAAGGGRLEDASQGMKRQAVAGRTLQSRGGRGNGTDDLGFSALPGGGRTSDDWYNKMENLRSSIGYGESPPLFHGIGDEGHWWTANRTSNAADNTAFYRSMGYNYGNYVYEDSGDKGSGYSVRCVQD